ncbi:ribonuclease H-like domain-containing protein [Tanacetum coccineum]
MLTPSSGALILYQAYSNLYAMTGRKAHLLEDKQIPSVGVFDEGVVKLLVEIPYDNRISYPPGFKRNPNLKVNGNFNNNKSNNADSKGNFMGNNKLKTSTVTLSFANEQVLKLMNLLNDKSGFTAHANTAGVSYHFGLNNNVILFHVLVFPEYRVSLLSVHKLIKDRKLSICFNETKCLILDLKKEKVWETSIESAGLYLFDVDSDKFMSFGCLCFAVVVKGSDKFSERSENYVLVGYASAEEVGPKRSQRTSKLPARLNEFVIDNKVNAMNEEMNALYENKTWDMTDLPLNRIPISSKWVFKIKYKSNGEVEKYKARLVAKGFGQKEGINYEDTFSHVVKMTTVRCLINLVVHNDWKIYQMDVNNALLWGFKRRCLYGSSSMVF